MKALGCHIIAELSECRPEVLADLDQVQAIMIQAAKEAKAEVREVAFHKFNPQGVSGVVVIAESHLSIHTWPEYGYAAIDIYTCGDSTDPWKACLYLAREFGASRVASTEVERGLSTEAGLYFHTIASHISQGDTLVAQDA